MLGLPRPVGDLRRAITMFLVVLVGVCSFVLLTGSAQQSRLDVQRTLDASARSSYDILVRPRGSQTAIERATGRVRPNYLSGIYGGITRAQVTAVESVPGVELAAPIAMVGQVLETAQVPIDVTSYVGESGRGLVRFSSTGSTADGLGHYAGPGGYVYVSRGVSADFDSDDLHTSETLPDGRLVPVCRDNASPMSGPFSADARWNPECWDRVDGYFGSRWPETRGHFYAMVPFSFPVTVAAIDPTAEARLTGLDVVRGSYFAEDQKPTPPDDDFSGPTVPVLMSTRNYMRDQLSVRLERLGPEAIHTVLRGGSRSRTRARLTAATGERVADVTITAQDALDSWLYGGLTDGTTLPRLFFTTGPVSYHRHGDGLVAEPVHVSANTWQASLFSGESFANVPMAAQLTGYRHIEAAPAFASSTTPYLQVQGRFDPEKLKQDLGLGRVPLETYQSPAVRAATAASAALLKGKPLYPSSSPGGYLQNPPLMLTTLSSLPVLTSDAFSWPHPEEKAKAPISVIRVRVAGVTGADALSRERVRLVAQQIHQRTGLPVDITMGSSPRPTRIELHTGGHTLEVSELWVQKGVATTVVRQIDRKSLALFVLVLLTTALSVSISANASIRARRRELGVLSCLGWRPSTLRRSVLVELTTVGLAAGVVGAAVSWPAGALLDAPVDTSRALVAIPAAVLLMFLAALWPARSAARAVPAEALRPRVRTPRRAMRAGGVVGLAFAYLRRTPARAVTGALSLAVGVCALVSLLGISLGFRGAVVGSLLGDAVAVQVRGADLVAAVLLVVIGLGSMLDVLFLDIREQGSAYAALEASGWRDRTLATLILTQGLVIALLGATIGTGTALGLLAWFAGLNTHIVLIGVAVAAGAVVVGTLLCLLPALSLRRLRTADLLAQEER